MSKRYGFTAARNRLPTLWLSRKQGGGRRPPLRIQKMGAGVKRRGGASARWLLALGVAFVAVAGTTVSLTGCGGNTATVTNGHAGHAGRDQPSDRAGYRRFLEPHLSGDAYCAIEGWGAAQILKHNLINTVTPSSHKKLKLTLALKIQLSSLKGGSRECRSTKLCCIRNGMESL